MSAIHPRSIVLIGLAALALGIPAATGPGVTGPGPAAPTGRARALTGGLAPTFVPNAGQLPPLVRYASQGPGHAIYFLPGEVALAFHGNDGRSVRLTLGFPGGRPGVEPEGRHHAAVRVNYLLGRDRARWRTGLVPYRELTYREVWPGVDVVFRGAEGRLKYELVVRPGGRIDAIHLAYRGVRDLSVDERGGLRIGTAAGVLTDEPPRSYQEVGGRTVPVTSRFVIDPPGGDAHGYGFAVGDEYDPRRPLVIDPGLAYATFLGGGALEFTPQIAVDATGHAYVAGTTSSVDFPTTPGAFDPSPSGTADVFVAKLDPTGSALLYATVLGGSGADLGEALAVDPAGNAYVTGRTTSADFPTTPGAFAPSYNGGPTDAYVAKLDPTGGTLLYSTFLGGSDTDLGLGIAVDDSGKAYVTGTTLSADFPTTAGAFDRTFNGGFQDAFVAKLDTAAAGAASLVYATYLGGGAAVDVGESIAIDGLGNAYVSGFTDSPDFPTTAGAFDRTFNGGFFTGQDLFVAKLDPAGASLVYSTFLGGSGREFFSRIAVDASGSAYVTARTSSADFPTTAGAYQRTFQGSAAVFPEIFDAVVVKLAPSGGALAYATFLGGSGSDMGSAIAVDVAGNAYVAGFTTSTDFPTTCDALARSPAGGTDAFLVRLNPPGSRLLYATFLGGGGLDAGLAVAVDTPGHAFVAGVTGSSDFPTTPGAFDRTYNGGAFDLFVARVSPPAAQVADIASAVSGLVATGALNAGQGNALVAKLDAATARLAAGNPQGAAQMLQAFVNQVEALVNAGILSPAQGQALIAAAADVAGQIAAC